MTPLGICDFCPRNAVMQLHRHRRTLLEMLRGRSAGSCRVCDDHRSRGLDFVRRLR